MQGRLLHRPGQGLYPAGVWKRGALNVAVYSSILFFISCISSCCCTTTGGATEKDGKAGPLQCKTSRGGFEYAGYENITRTGKACQTWVMQKPNKHGYVMENFPDESLQAAGYYCRNPNKDPKGPWCFLHDKEGSEYCDVPYCDEGVKERRECRLDRKGLDYRGTMNQTVSGFTCQRWDAQKPHKHIYTDYTQFPENNLGDAANYCRNPDGEVDGPWCFTTHVTRGWELCPIPYCHTDECKTNFPGADYAGRARHTITGRKCQRWDSQVPNKHSYHKNSLFPEATVTLAENFCRNPDPVGKPNGPWCFITDLETSNKTLFEHCDIPKCDLTDEHWTDIFVKYKKWAGQYLFNKKWRFFNLSVKGIKFPYEDQRGGVLTGLFDDGSSQFDVEGWVNDENVFMFRQTKQHHVAKWFLHGFYVSGHLLYDDNNATWRFVAIPQSGMMAIQKYEMSPIVNETTAGISCAAKPERNHSDAGVAVGVTLGVELLILIIVGFAIYIKKKGPVSDYKRYFVFHNPSGVQEDAERL